MSQDLLAKAFTLWWRWLPVEDFEVIQILPHIHKREVTIFVRVNGQIKYLTAYLMKNPRTLNDLISPENLLVISKGTLKGGTYEH